MPSTPCWFVGVGLVLRGPIGFQDRCTKDAQSYLRRYRALCPGSAGPEPDQPVRSRTVRLPEQRTARVVAVQRRVSNPHDGGILRRRVPARNQDAYLLSRFRINARVQPASWMKFPGFAGCSGTAGYRTRRRIRMPWTSGSATSNWETRKADPGRIGIRPYLSGNNPQKSHPGRTYSY